MWTFRVLCMVLVTIGNDYHDYASSASIARS